jgi:prepilin-type N-terminal cleavage/methylation domain-containing protein
VKSERGFSLVEVIIAIALLGIVAVAFLGGLSTASNAIFHADERATAESLARTEMEYLRNQDYIDYSVTGHAEYQSITPPSGYNIVVSVERLDMDPPPGDPDDDDGIQKITVFVYHPYDAANPDDYVVRLEGYKSRR